MTKTKAQSIRWSLKDLFNSIKDPKIQEVLKTSKQQATKFAKTYKNKLSTLTPQELSDAFKAKESLLIPLYKLSQFANLEYAINSADDDIKALVDRIDTIESQVANEILFFTLELGKLNKSPDLKDYNYNLYMIQKNAKYHLTEKEEKVINLKDLSGVQALKKLYQELTTSFKFEFEIDNEKKMMNGSELRALRHHEKPEIRRKAMKLFFNHYKDHELTITHLFNAILKDHNTERELRDYSSPISIMNTHNDLDDEIVETLHQVTSESYKLVNRYYKLKKKIINLPKMTLADIYAPMPQSNKKYTFDEAKTIVLNGFKDFDQEFYDLAKRIFDKKRIDAPIDKHKRGGAFCYSSVPGLDPWVMLNFQGLERDVSTMAHELGHAIHSMLANKQNLFNFHAILPLAETASVFGEMIITDVLLKNETNKTNKIAILTTKLEDIFATSHRQNMFSTFEKLSHQKVSKGRVSSKEFCQTYFTEIQKMFGNAIEYTEEYQWEWASIPHMFEVPFYVYAYNFGNLLVMALYELYLEQGKTFIPGFKNLLAMGSSASPEKITASVGVNIKNPDFWQKSLKYIERLIDELEELI